MMSAENMTNTADMWGDIVGPQPVAKPRVDFAAVVAALPPRQKPPVVYGDDEFGFGSQVFAESVYG